MKPWHRRITPMDKIPESHAKYGPYAINPKFTHKCIATKIECENISPNSIDKQQP